MPDLNISKDGASFNALGSLFHARQALKTKSLVPVIFLGGRNKDIPSCKE